MAPRTKRVRRDTRSSDRSSSSSRSISSSPTRTPPSRDRRKRSRQSSRSSTRSIEALTQVLSGLLTTQPQKAIPSCSTFGGDSIPPFNPEEVTLPIETWCIKVDELRHLYQWNEQSTTYFALAKLRGLAATWYRSLPSVSYSWEEWKSKLVHAFPTRRNFCEALQEMLNRRKRVEETYTKYYYEKLALLNSCRITGRDAVSCIIGGISEEHITSAANAGNYADPEALFTYLRTLPQPVQPRVSSERRLQQGKRFDNRDRHHGHKGKSFKKVSSQSTPMTTTSACFQCGKTGHFKQNCPMNKNSKCGICGKAGHLEERCYRRNHQNPVA